MQGARQLSTGSQSARPASDRPTRQRFGNQHRRASFRVVSTEQSFFTKMTNFFTGQACNVFGPRCYVGDYRGLNHNKRDLLDPKKYFLTNKMDLFDNFERDFFENMSAKSIIFVYMTLIFRLNCYLQTLI